MLRAYGKSSSYEVGGVGARDTAHSNASVMGPRRGQRGRGSWGKCEPSSEDSLVLSLYELLNLRSENDRMRFFFFCRRYIPLRYMT